MHTKKSVEKNVYTIQAGLSFVDVLALGLNQKIVGSSIPLTDCTILLPTRRAVRSLREAFLRGSAGKPILLPRLIPLGDLDEDELVLSGWEDSSLLANGEIPPAISSLRRHLLLTQLVQAFDNKTSSPDKAARLAVALARLLDQVQTERLSFDGLNKLVPEDYAEHWQITLKFLEILTKEWPAILKEHGCLDPADRRNKLLENQAKLWKATPPKGYIIAAGSTGSIPATADLLDLVAGLPNGCVILPGLDQTLNEGELPVLEPSHPQYGMAQLLSRMGVNIKEVRAWEVPGFKPVQNERADLIHVALRPSSSIDTWRQHQIPSPEALETAEYVVCPSPDEETGVIALMMRKTLEERGKTAALITPDRELARRVASQLHRWDIEIDDSAGLPLSNVPTTIFLRLTAELVVRQFKSVDILAACKHPIAACGLAPAKLRDLIRRLEVKALRGPRPAPGIEGLLMVLEDRNDELHGLLERLGEWSQNFAQLSAQSNVALQKIVAAHVAFTENFAASNTESGAERLWVGTAGETAAEFMSDLTKNADVFDCLPGKSYPALLETLMAGRVVRPRYGKHPRLHIWGLLEARLQQADLMILGGLNEGTWPPEAYADPWMSRSMRKKFGLPLLERRIGLSAHDFTQAFCAPKIALTRSQRVGGMPMVPARWLLRLTQFLKGMNIGSALRPKHPWNQWLALLDTPKEILPCSPPAPKPPVSARPRQLSVTQVETWMRDPYSIYARHILKLKPLRGLDLAPDAAEFGTLIHRILDRFTDDFPVNSNKTLPENAEQFLIELGRKQFEVVLNYPGIWAFWWPRFLRIAHWFVNREREARAGIVEIKSEVKGYLELTGPAGPFTLSAVADRIDRLLDGQLCIVDYKTGALPSKKEIRAGFAPQLPLEAAIAGSDGFKTVSANKVVALDYWRLKGGDPAGEISSAGDNPWVLAKAAIEGLESLIQAFDREDTPYEARPRPEQAPNYSDYEHLARVKEWGVSGNLLEGRED